MDENSLNGTFVNGEKVSGAPQRVYDGDEIKLGSETRIAVEISEQSAVASLPLEATQKISTPKIELKPNSKFQIPNSKSAKPLVILLVAIGSVFLILIVGVVALIIASKYGGDTANNGKPTPQTVKAALIPVRVIDPLGGEDPDDLDDLIGFVGSRRSTDQSRRPRRN